MMKIALMFVLGVGTAFTAASYAAELQATPAITVVPFAVPVAVPVAVVQRPTLFYGVGGSVAPSAAPVSGQVAPLPERATLPSESEHLRERAATILKRHCAECHHGAQAQGGVVLFDDAGRLQLLLPRFLVVDATESTAERLPVMPPDGREKLSRDEWQVLKQWARMPKSFVY